MKHKTAELSGALLDAAVAMAEGRVFDLHRMAPHGADFLTVVDPEQSGWVTWSPSRLWEDGGPIIERERISLFAPDRADGMWKAVIRTSDNKPLSMYADPARPLIAAMRAYVVSKLGEDVDLSKVGADPQA